MSLKDKFKKPKNETTSFKPTRNLAKQKEAEILMSLDNQPALSKSKPTKVITPSVSVSLINALAEKFPPERIVGYIEALMVATHKTNGGQIIPDNRAREAGTKLLMSYLVGLPIQRQEIVNINVDGNNEAAEKAILGSPALRSALAAKIQQAEEEERKSLPPSEHNRGNG